MPAKRRLKTLQLFCLELLVKLYFDVLKTPKFSDHVKEVNSFFQILPQSLFLLFTNKLSTSQLRPTYPDARTVRNIYQSLITPVVKDLCLVPFPFYLGHSDCRLRFNLSSLHRIGYDEFDADCILFESLSIEELHLDGFPTRIRDVLEKLPRLRSLCINTYGNGGETFEQSALQELMEHLKDSLTIDQIYISCVKSFPRSMLEDIVEIKHIRLLYLGCRNVPVEAATKMVCNLPFIEEFGWTDHNDYSYALVTLYKYMKPICTHGCLLKKLKRWIGCVELKNCLTQGDEALWEKLNIDVRTMPRSRGQDRSSGEVYGIEIEGRFGLVTLLKAHNYLDCDIKRFLYFNGKMMTSLVMYGGEIAVNTVESIPRLCPSLQVLSIQSEFVQGPTGYYLEDVPVLTASAGYQSSCASGSLEIFDLKELKCLLLHRRKCKSIHSAEQTCLKKLLAASSGSLQDLAVDMQRNKIKDKQFVEVFSKEMRCLEKVSFYGSELNLSCISVQHLLDVAPVLSRLMFLGKWKQVTKTYVETLKQKIEENAWDLEVF